ncbi:pyridoxal phosphate-dependent aminotransferase [Thalassotalea loyana]|nr:pyridoxal phosphate-dependent aminotransferase [Thalassotalea loyana]
MHNMTQLATIELPPHIAFSRSIEGDIAVNLSHSGGQSMSVNSLLAYCDGQRQSMAEIDLSYASISGSKSLRQAISNFHHQVFDQTWIKPKHVTTFAGAQEALSCLYQLLIEPADEVIVMTPSYPSLQSMVGDLDGKLIPIPLEFKEQWKVDWHAFERAFSEKTSLVVINSPHNPTGMALTEEELAHVVSLCKQHDCYLLIDDVSHASQYQKRMASRHIRYDKTVFINVMSKSLGLAGIRIGWAITDDKKLRNGLLACKAKASICTSVIDEYLAELALDNCQRILARNNAIIETNIQKFNQFLTQHPDISWHQPTSGILSTIKFSKRILGNQSMESWAKDCAEKTGVLLLPTSLFGLTGPYCRLGLGQKNFEEGLNRLALYLKGL